MSDRHTLPDDLHALLQAERGVETVSPALRANLTRRLSASLGVALSAPASPEPPSPVAEGVTTATRWLLQKPLVAALVFGAGAAVGSAATLGIQVEPHQPLPAAVATVTPPTAAAEAVRAVQAAPQVAAKPAPQAVAKAVPQAVAKAAPEPERGARPALESAHVVTTRPRAARPSSETDLRSERQWIDRARSALERANPEDALLALAAHQQRYPSGQLAEERASLNIVALVRAGRNVEAERAVHGFRSKYPNSLFTAMVEQALARTR